MAGRESRRRQRGAESSAAGGTIRPRHERPGSPMNYARRQQYRWLLRAGEAAAGGTIVALLGVVAASVGAAYLAAALVLTAVALGLYSRHWISLARRSAVGARSEDAVQGALAPLQTEGWRLRHSPPWQGQGDIDSWRSHRPGSRSRSRPRPGRTTGAISLGCASRWPGSHGAGEDGHATAPSASCASSVRAASSASSMTFWWSRSIG